MDKNSALSLAAARMSGVCRAYARGNALYELGVVRLITGDCPGAAGAAEAALSIYRDLGDQQGEASALTDLGTVRRMTGDYAGAAGAAEAALSIYRDLGHRLGQGTALSELGVVRRMTRDYPGAAQALEEALSIYRDLGHRLGQGTALSELGAVRRMTRDYPGAARALQEAGPAFVPSLRPRRAPARIAGALPGGLARVEFIDYTARWLVVRGAKPDLLGTER